MTDYAAIADRVMGPHWRLKAAIRRGLTRRQARAYADPARRKALHPGRRSGKSTGLPAYALMDALDCRPAQGMQLAEVVLLGSETKQKAEALYWSPVAALITAHRLPLAWNGKLGAFLHTRRDGSGVYLWGCADKGAADMMRGFKVRAGYFDEVATYSSLLRYIAEEALGPALADCDGALTFAGTPSLTRAGDWFDICAGRTEETWSVHHWDVRENELFPRDPVATLEAEARRYGGWDSAKFQREWLGLFVDDADAQVYKYLPERNDCEPPQHYDPHTWVHHLIVDFGVRDDCAWATLACHPHEQVVYVLEAFKRPGLRVSESAEVTARLAQKYRPVAILGDAGGLGAPYVLEWNARFAAQLGMPPMLPADKREKRAGIELLNDALRAGKVRLVKGACAALASELSSLPWKDDLRLVEHPAYANHCADALLYGFKSIFAYLQSAPDTRPDPADDPQGADRWAEAREMEQLQRSQQDADAADWGAF